MLEAKKKSWTGALVYDKSIDRYCIRFDAGGRSYGLHCGDCFDVFYRNRWRPSRLEMDHSDGDRWYVMGGINTFDLEGLRVRIFGY